MYVILTYILDLTKQLKNLKSKKDKQDGKKEK